MASGAAAPAAMDLTVPWEASNVQLSALPLNSSYLSFRDAVNTGEFSLAKVALNQDSGSSLIRNFFVPKIRTAFSYAVQIIILRRSKKNMSRVNTSRVIAKMAGKKASNWAERKLVGKSMRLYRLSSAMVFNRGFEYSIPVFIFRACPLPASLGLVYKFPKPIIHEVSLTKKG